MSDSLADKLEKIITALIKGAIFLLPLFFLPWTSEYFEFNKQFLLWLIMPIAVSLWLIKAVAQGQIKIKINPLNLPVLIFLLLTLASSVFSLDKFSSFFGYFGRFSDAWLGLFGLVIFYWLLINTGVADSTEKIIKLLKIFLYSSMVMALVSLGAIFGVLKIILGQPLNIFSSASFNLAGGSLPASGIFLAIISIILANFLFHGNLKKIDRIIFSASLVIFLVILALINFSLSWVIVLLGAGLMMAFRWPAGEFKLKKIANYYLLIPVVLILMAAIFLVWPAINPAKIILGQELPREALLEYNQAWSITKEAFKKNPALGSGPGTFSEDFSLYRPVEFNSSIFWQVRFDKSSSHLLEMLATSGLSTCLSYFLIISLIVYLNIILIKKYFKKSQATASEDYSLIITLFIVFILILISEFFFLTNTVLNFIFWFCLGLIIAFWQLYGQPLFKEKIIDLQKTVLFYRSFFLVLFILGVGLIILLALEIKFFAADLIAAQGANREKNLLTAIKLNPYRYNYNIILAKLYLNRARLEALKPAEQRNNINLQSDITQAVETARRAALIAPNSVLAQETLGMVYRDIRLLTLGSEPWAVKSFSRALELEPTNPVLATELAKAYMDNNDPVNGEKHFLKALELKGNYYNAKLGLAKAYLKNKKDSQAFVLLNELARQVKTAEVYYELGRFYYNHGEADKAIDIFKLALSLSPKHSNGLYSLAAAYEAKGDIKEALKYYQQVLELNQGYAEVIEKIKNLSK